MARLRGIRGKTIFDFLKMSRSTMARQARRFSTDGVEPLLTYTRVSANKTENARYKDALFEILHAPPSDYDINRTTWRLKDLQRVMKEKGFPIGKSGISKIISDAGYHFRKAKKVLTSTDPEYREKLKKITDILSNLKPTEKFFSIDEFGPFAVQMRGGRSLVKRGEARTVPQFQKSKGILILTGALELSTNQMTHFYSKQKNTDEMIKLLEVLLKKYRSEKCIYFSWDAASWHASKKLYEKVEEVNSSAYHRKHKMPMVKLAPLPSSAQFLNVIESVFSGMARAIIHNSDYQSVDECKAAIDRHFAERNEHFKRHPKRAGNKIWGKERVPPVFNESNNCKDPQYR
ncbi:MAG TPA: IS630 family transposase [Bacteroidetes bacterium]|nr:IS630 family transposase [Bacteroidota bacterium]HEX05103.1 IS630 family transposase [Bacteroidota bacterium]